MECFVSPRSARRFLQCLSFGAIALWIILGAYLRHEEPQQPALAASRAGGSRHLLSLSEEELGSISQQECVAINMTYKDNGTVNLADDQVREPNKEQLVQKCGIGMVAWPELKYTHLMLRFNGLF